MGGLFQSLWHLPCGSLWHFWLGSQAYKDMCKQNRVCWRSRICTHSRIFHHSWRTRVGAGLFWMQTTSGCYTDWTEWKRCVFKMHESCWLKERKILDRVVIESGEFLNWTCPRFFQEGSCVRRPAFSREKSEIRASHLVVQSRWLISAVDFWRNGNESKILYRRSLSCLHGPVSVWLPWFGMMVFQLVVGRLLVAAAAAGRYYLA